MAVLGKRKAPATEADAEHAADVFRQYFEARFEPLPPPQSQQDDGGPGADDEDESEWEGLSDDEVSDDEGLQVVEVVDHSASQTPKAAAMSKRELRAFMSSRPPNQSSPPEDGATVASSETQPALSKLPEDAPSLLAQDLELRRLLAESHLLNPSLSTSVSSSASEPKAFAAGRTRHKATDLRVQALGSKTSIHAQRSMPMAMRKGMVAAAEGREAKRRSEARENGVVLEREAAGGGGKKTKRGRARGGGDVDRPGVGRLKGAELRVSERDVKKIEGGRDVFGRRGPR